jgi:hypothetical protein
MLPTAQQADLIWFFSYGVCAFQRSGFGPALERAQAHSRTSDGRRIPRRDRSSWQHRTIKRDDAEPSYVPDMEAMLRWARISRMLRGLDAKHSAVIEVYYGDIGTRWASTKLGRIFGLFAFTPGAKAVLRARPAQDDLRSDERLFQLLQKRARPTWLKLRAEADAVLRGAHAALAELS